jgi:hypothetical protein
MEDYITGTGQLVHVHEKEDCEGNCSIHNPSDHHMVNWPTHWRDDRGLMERICPHGIGHPDPDDIEFKRQKFGDKFADTESVHGCDGCCNEATFIEKSKKGDHAIIIFELKQDMSLLQERIDSLVSGIKLALATFIEAGDNRAEIRKILKGLLK